MYSIKLMTTYGQLSECTLCVLALLYSGGDFLSDKPFKTIKDQLSLLGTERHLTILNAEAAEQALRRYGYYEIINGYKTPFLVEPGNDDAGYKTNATFEHIYALYALDREIRDSLKQGLEQFEQTFKQTLAYVIAQEISDNQSKYTDVSHYDKGEAHINPKNGKFVGTDRDRLLRKINKLLNSTKQPYAHYRKEHHNIPPWILVKGLMFGETIYLYKLSKNDVREKVVAKMFNLDSSMLEQIDPLMNIKQAFGDILSLSLDYRNLASHSGRVYNHRSNKHALKWSNFIYRKNVIDINKNQFENKEMRSSVGTLLTVLSLFENKDPYSNISIWLSIHLDSYLQKYPEDKDMLENSMELKVTALPNIPHITK